MGFRSSIGKAVFEPAVPSCHHVSSSVAETVSTLLRLARRGLTQRGPYAAELVRVQVGIAVPPPVALARAVDSPEDARVADLRVIVENAQNLPPSDSSHTEAARAFCAKPASSHGDHQGIWHGRRQAQHHLDSAYRLPGKLSPTPSVTVPGLSAGP